MQQSNGAVDVFTPRIPLLWNLAEKQARARQINSGGSISTDPDPPDLHERRRKTLTLPSLAKEDRHQQRPLREAGDGQSGGLRAAPPWRRISIAARGRKPMIAPA
jgi:hypothetical protein